MSGSNIVVQAELVDDEVEVRIDISEMVSEHGDEIREQMQEQGFLDGDHHTQSDLRELLNTCEAIEVKLSNMRLAIAKHLV